ncbi:MAG: hypothetical protein P8Y66_11295 [Nitrospirota bacterium]|jgi:peroxiredoxin
MARADTPPLDTGDRFPQMAFQSTEGGTVALPGDLGGRWAVLIFYRGHF